MEALVVGALTACTVGIALTLWYLLVHPGLVMYLWDEEQPLTDDGFFEEGEDTAAVSALTWTLGGVLVLVSFTTGAATAFLASTTY